jgi:hypothetical protein
MVKRATRGLHAAGVPNINFDLIYEPPHQNAAALCRTVERCVAMKPDRIALLWYAHAPWVATMRSSLQGRSDRGRRHYGFVDVFLLSRMHAYQNLNCLDDPLGVANEIAVDPLRRQVLDHAG